MRLEAHPDTLSDRRHLVYLSRHIYCLAAALVHLITATYATPFEVPLARRAQWFGSTALVISSGFLMSAFVHEAIGDRPRTFLSTWGLYLLFGGVMLHTVAGFIDRRNNPSA